MRPRGMKSKLNSPSSRGNGLIPLSAQTLIVTCRGWRLSRIRVSSHGSQRYFRAVLFCLGQIRAIVPEARLIVGAVNRHDSAPGSPAS